MSRQLQAITCPALLAQKSVLELLWQHMDTEYTDWPVAIREESWFSLYCLSHQPGSFAFNENHAVETTYHISFDLRQSANHLLTTWSSASDLN